MFFTYAAIERPAPISVHSSWNTTRGMSGCRTMLCGAPTSSSFVYPLTRVNTRLPLRMMPLRSVVEKKISCTANGRSTGIGWTVLRAICPASMHAARRRAASAARGNP